MRALVNFIREKLEERRGSRFESGFHKLTEKRVERTVNALVRNSHWASILPGVAREFMARRAEKRFLELTNWKLRLEFERIASARGIGEDEVISAEETDEILPLAKEKVDADLAQVKKFSIGGSEEEREHNALTTFTTERIPRELTDFIRERDARRKKT